MAGTDGAATDLLLRTGRWFTRGEVSPDLRTVTKAGGRAGDVFYRDRWSHDKVVRSTHGVNCTRFVPLEGLRQRRDHHLGDPGDRLPLGRARPARVRTARLPARRRLLLVHLLPTRVRYPYVRGVPLEQYREARRRLGDPVLAWAEVTDDPERRRYQRARGKGGFVRAGWDEAVELVAAAHVHTIKRYGPDRIAGFSPIPAMALAGCMYAFARMRTAGRARG